MEASLLVRKAKINPAVLIAQSKGLEVGTAKYSITRTEEVLTITAGVQGKLLDNVYLGQMPKRCVSTYAVLNRHNIIIQITYNKQTGTITFKVFI